MSTNLSSVPKLQFFDANGNPLAGGKLYTYAAGTTTPLATYTDSTGLTPNTNPIILDSRGEADVWLDATQYKFELTTAADALIWTVDNISNALNLSQLLASSGSAAAPPYTFAADPTTGMYLQAVGQIGLSANGKPVLRSTDVTMVIGQIGGADDVDVTLYGDLAQTGNVTLAGNMAFSGTGRRITGDFSNATVANRLMFQTSTVDAQTVVSVAPNGTSSGSNFVAYNNSNPTNSSRARIGIDATIVAIHADITGTGTYLPLTIYTGGSERVRVDTSGNVGIGTSAPLGKLKVAIGDVAPAASGNMDTGVIFESAASARAINIGVNNTAGYSWINAAFANNSGVPAPLVFMTGATERMRIDSSGNVGIGTNAPVAKVHVVGTGAVLLNATTGDTSEFSVGAADFYSAPSFSGLVSRYSGSAVAGTTLGLSNANLSSLVFQNSQGLIYTNGLNPLVFGTVNAERMRIDTSGNVGIGTSSPGDKLVVAASSGAVYAGVNNGTVNTVFGVSAGNVGLLGTTTNHDVLLYANNTERARITAAGLFQYNSGYGSVATAFGCRAWINFNGTGTPAARASGNVSSITDNGTGDYTINFTTAMPDANYSVNVACNRVVADGYAGLISTAAGSARIVTYEAGNFTDQSLICAAIFR